MGWLIPYNTPTKASLVELILRDKERAENVVLAHRVVGNNLWIALRVGPNAGDPACVGKKLIVLYLMDQDGKNWGYKDLDETMEPYHYDCPLSFLDMAKDFEDHPRSAAWRKDVRAYHAEQKAKAAVQLLPGIEVQLQAGTCALEGPYHAKGYWIVRRLTDGARFRARVSDLKDILFAMRKPVADVVVPTQDGLFA